MQIVRFVSAVSGGTVLLDLSPGGSNAMQLGEGFSAPPPPLNRTMFSSVLRDGGVVGASSFDLRTVKLPVVLPTFVGTVAAASAARQAAITSLFRVLTQDKMWLEVRPDGATTSRFLRCYRASEADLEAMLSRSWASMTFTLLADPFAFGALVSLGTVATDYSGRFVTQIPAASITGDVPTPLIIQQSMASLDRGTYYVGSRTGPMPHDPLLDFGTGGSPSSWTGVPGSSTITSDGEAQGGAYVTSTLTTVGASTYDQGTLIGLRSGQTDRTALAGQYRVLLLLTPWPTSAAGNSLDRWEFSLQLGVFGGDVSQTRTVLWDNTMSYVVDMGLIEVPTSGQTYVGPGGKIALADVQGSLAVTRRHATGTGSDTIRWDALIVIPADEQFLALKRENTVGAANWSTLDPYTGRTVSQDAAAGSILSRPLPQSYVGVPPQLTPGQDCNLVMFGAGITSQGIHSDLLARSRSSVSFACSYYPQFLTVV